MENKRFGIKQKDKEMSAEDMPRRRGEGTEPRTQMNPFALESKWGTSFSGPEE